MKYVFSVKEVAEIVAREAARRAGLKDDYYFTAEFKLQMKRFRSSASLQSMSIEFIEEDR